MGKGKLQEIFICYFINIIHDISSTLGIKIRNVIFFPI